MSTPPAPGPCRNCGRVPQDGELDHFGWCNRCRAAVIRRATWAARVAATVVTLLFAGWVFAVLDPGPRILIVWLVLIAAVYFLVYKLTQRVSFEAIRARGVPPPEE